LIVLEAGGVVSDVSGRNENENFDLFGSSVLATSCKELQQEVQYRIFFFIIDIFIFKT
jgi:hypothetical protein